MSFLQNPSFENGSVAPWNRVNLSGAGSFSVATDSSIARSGDRYLRFRTSEPFGSIAQDFVVAAPSVTALAYVRSGGPNTVNGQLTIWELQGGRNITTYFNVGPSWVLLTNTLGLTAGANRTVRIEFYLYTVNVDLLVDSVNAF